MAVAACSGRVRGWVATLALAAMLSLAPAGTRAHAVLVDSSLQQSPPKAQVAASVTVRFNSSVEVGLSRVLLVTAGDKEQTLAIRAGDKPGELVVSIPALAEGRYALRYRIFATDGHLTDGVIRFRVSK